MKFYDSEIEQVLEKLNSNNEGLSTKEANNRIKKYGKNKLAETKKKSNLSKFLDEFKDLMIIVLILSAIISFILSIINKESYLDSIIIIVVVILNAILGFIQELKADKSLESLKKMQINKIKVKRENKICVVDSEDITVGDILVLEAGDTIPADARIIWEASLKVDESALTGESIPVSKNVNVLEKDTPLSSRINMIYCGTNIVYGKCHAVVCEVGMKTEFGLIAESLNNEVKEITPLQKRIGDISKFLSIIIAIIIVIMFIIGLITKMKILEIVMLSISLAVAAIPEGLPAVITVTLSLGMNDLARKNAIVRKMSSVETLGCTEIICSDKTGTITQNKMKVREVFYNNKIHNIDELDDNLLLKIMALNNDVEKNLDNYIGDPTEIALYELCEEHIDINLLKRKNRRIDELPFDSDRKMMSVIIDDEKDITIYTKGSFDSLIKHCSYIYENNEIKKLDKNKIEKLKQIEMEESNKAYRILAYAYAKIDNSYKLGNDLEKDLIFVGMSAMIDPPRVDVKEAIKLCKCAHIKPVMITGDSLQTAKSIAKEVGILDTDSEAITGIELDKMTDEELVKNVNKYSVYARVSPMNKLSIVNAWKKNDKVVAMTGDGVNDAPALKQADIGVGMGIAGTEVSKSVSDIVLVDDSFSTIVTAVKEGRRIFDNIRNVLVYLLTGNITEILVVFICMLFGIEIFLPIQLLYINLITDSIPAISLAFEKAEDNIMDREIRKKNSTFFTPFLISKIIVSSILKTIGILVVYFVGLNLYNVEVAMTMSFLTLILFELFFAYSCRNLKEAVLNKHFFDNKYVNVAVLGLILIQIIIFSTPIKFIFNIIDLNLIQIIYCIIVVIFIVSIDELLKNVISKSFND